MHSRLSWQEWDTIRDINFTDKLALMFPFLIDVYYVPALPTSREAAFVFVIDDNDESKITWINLKL